MLLFSFSVTSCSKKEADHEKFVDAYIDFRVAQDTLKNDSTDIGELKSEILKRHGLTEKQYESTFEDLNENPEQWEQFYNEAIARVDSLKKLKK